MSTCKNNFNLTTDYKNISFKISFSFVFLSFDTINNLQKIKNKTSMTALSFF